MLFFTFLGFLKWINSLEARAKFHNETCQKSWEMTTKISQLEQTYKKKLAQLWCYCVLLQPTGEVLNPSQEKAVGSSKERWWCREPRKLVFFSTFLSNNTQYPQAENCLPFPPWSDLAELNRITMMPMPPHPTFLPEEKIPMYQTRFS